MIQIFEYLKRTTNYLLRWFRGEKLEVGEKTGNRNIEHPSFSTNIFDECEENTGDGHDHQMLWFCVVIIIFFLGVASSYYIIHH